VKPVRIGICAAILVSVSSVLAASDVRLVPFAERARGAERVVIATVAETSARYERNDFGDELIVTDARLAVEEAVKGPAEPVTVTIEGGTLNGITLQVSSLPSVRRGERAVFFLTRGSNGQFRLHLRGSGMLKLDANNQVVGSAITLDEVRQQIRSAKQ
jgi:hypothetical protein